MSWSGDWRGAWEGWWQDGTTTPPVEAEPGAVYGVLQDTPQGYFAALAEVPALFVVVATQAYLAVIAEVPHG